MSRSMNRYERKDRRSAMYVFENSYAVYILRCRTRDEQFIDDFAMDKIGKKPEWAREAVKHDQIYYIGQTKNMFQRIGQHINGRGADFTRVFPVQTIMEIKFCSDRERARAVEEALSSEYRAWEDAYCYFS